MQSSKLSTISVLSLFGLMTSLATGFIIARTTPPVADCYSDKSKQSGFLFFNDPVAKLNRSSFSNELLQKSTKDTGAENNKIVEKFCNKGQPDDELVELHNREKLRKSGVEFFPPLQQQQEQSVYIPKAKKLLRNGAFHIMVEHPGKTKQPVRALLQIYESPPVQGQLQQKIQDESLQQQQKQQQQELQIEKQLLGKVLLQLANLQPQAPRKISLSALYKPFSSQASTFNDSAGNKPPDGPENSIINVNQQELVKKIEQIIERAEQYQEEQQQHQVEQQLLQQQIKQQLEQQEQLQRQLQEQQQSLPQLEQQQQSLPQVVQQQKPLPEENTGIYYLERQFPNDSDTGMKNHTRLFVDMDNIAIQFLHNNSSLQHNPFTKRVMRGNYFNTTEMNHMATEPLLNVVPNKELSIAKISHNLQLIKSLTQVIKDNYNSLINLRQLLNNEYGDISKNDNILSLYKMKTKNNNFLSQEIKTTQSPANFVLENRVFLKEDVTPAYGDELHPATFNLLPLKTDAVRVTLNKITKNLQDDYPNWKNNKQLLFHWMNTSEFLIKRTSRKTAVGNQGRSNSNSFSVTYPLCAKSRDKLKFRWFNVRKQQRLDRKSREIAEKENAVDDLYISVPEPQSPPPLPPPPPSLLATVSNSYGLDGFGGVEQKIGNRILFLKKGIPTETLPPWCTESKYHKYATTKRINQPGGDGAGELSVDERQTLATPDLKVACPPQTTPMAAQQPEVQQTVPQPPHLPPRPPLPPHSPTVTQRVESTLLTTLYQKNKPYQQQCRTTKKSTGICCQIQPPNNNNQPVQPFPLHQPPSQPPPYQQQLPPDHQESPLPLLTTTKKPWSKIWAVTTRKSQSGIARCPICLSEFTYKLTFQKPSMKYCKNKNPGNLP